MKFDAEQVKNAAVAWIRDWFAANGEGCRAVIGISGGKDSSVVAALCVEALGRARVLGVLMPNGVQRDIADARCLALHLGIEHFTANIADAFRAVDEELGAHILVSGWARVNLAPRLRMATLYAVSQSVNGRVANTCNLSEDYVGYSTLYGDAAGDFSPLASLTATEVVAVGHALGLPALLVDKIPADGLTDRSDEDNLGFTYAVLDRYIREGVCDDPAIRQKIDARHAANAFKMRPMARFVQGELRAPILW
ncbi:MAG: NAD(+) synthase [Clostridiales bacterium]|nr:NAD(+) synthase [Clostridiales bacterium]